MNRSALNRRRYQCRYRRRDAEKLRVRPKKNPHTRRFDLFVFAGKLPVVRRNDLKRALCSVNAASGASISDFQGHKRINGSRLCTERTEVMAF